jgi:D-alanyl-D-alanine carboxypeptidase
VTALPTGVADTTARRLLRLLADRQTAGHLPSLVAGVVRDGELAWTGAYGDAGDQPDDVQYRIGSITKTFTAVLVLQLVRDGRVELDMPASRVLGDVGYADRTLRALLSHSSGIQSEPHGSWWERSAGVTWDELTARHDGSGAVFPDRQQFHYSNLGYALLGELVARVLDTTWADAVHDRILEPLGLERTSYLPTGRSAPGWSVDPYAGTLTPEPATDTGAMAPAGQLWSTVGDLARYAAFLAAGDPDVLDVSWLELAAHPQAGERDSGLESGHSVGFQLRRGGSGMLVGHTGSMPGFLAACLVDRARRTGAVLLCNATTGLAPGVLARDLLEELERQEPTLSPPWRPTTDVPEVLDGVLGVWHWGNTPYVVGLEGGDVVMSRNGVVLERFALRDDVVVGTEGYHAGETLHVVRRDDGSVRHLECATFVYTRTPYDPEAPIPGGVPEV